MLSPNMKYYRFCILLICTLSAAACASHPSSDSSSATDTAPVSHTAEDSSIEQTPPPDEFDAEEAYVDSISMITGIGYGSPYWYDPSWDLAYSDGLDTLLYYPRDREAAYFTIPASVRVIEERAFQCNQHLKEIVIPEGVGRIGVGAFLSSHMLRTVTIRGQVEELPWRVFDGCPELRSVELPWSVKSIAGMAFSDCGKLRRIVIRAPEPPTLEGCEPGEEMDEMWAFAGVDTDNCVVQVPSGSEKKYRDAPGWSRFRHIE